MPVIRNPHNYLVTGIAFSRHGRDVALKFRLQVPSVFDAASPRLTSTYKGISTEFLLALLNSDAIVPVEFASGLQCVIGVQIFFVKAARLRKRPSHRTRAAVVFSFDPVARQKLGGSETSVSKLSRKILPSFFTLPK